LNDAQENMVNEKASTADNSPGAWTRSFCFICNEAIDKLAADMLRVKLSKMSKKELRRAKENNDPSIHVSIKDLTHSISAGFGTFCDSLNPSDKPSPLEGEDDVAELASLSIENIRTIDQSHDKAREDEVAQTNLSRLIGKLRISTIAFWFMMYIIMQMKEEEERAMMLYLYGIGGSDAIFNDETFSELERWKTEDGRLGRKGTLNPDSMTFILMFHRP
jgi:hypothetical protein